MRTQPRTPPASRACLAGHDGLKAMLREGQRERQSLLHRRVRHTLPDGPNGGQDETERADVDARTTSESP